MWLSQTYIMSASQGSSTRSSAASFVSGKLSHLQSLVPESAATQALRKKVQGSTICIQPIYLGDPNTIGSRFPGERRYGIRVLTTFRTLDNFASHPAHDDIYRIHLLSKIQKDESARMRNSEQSDASVPTGSELETMWGNVVKREVAEEKERYGDVSVITAEEAEILSTFTDPKWRQMEEPGNMSGAF